MIGAQMHLPAVATPQGIGTDTGLVLQAQGLLLKAGVPAPMHAH